MSNRVVAEAAHKKIWGMHHNIFFLGLVSLLTDISSEMIFTLVPLVVTNVIGAGALAVGFIGGLSESFDAVFRIFSGRLSDRIKKRKLLAVIGYGFSTLCKPFMLLANVWGGVLAVRFGDRVGKGIRTSPRDALIADSVVLEKRGKGFGSTAPWILQALSWDWLSPPLSSMLSREMVSPSARNPTAGW